MAATAIMTFQDACELLWHTFNPAVKPPTGRELIAAKNAVIKTYRDLPQRHKWSYYSRKGLIATDASYSTGTVVFDLTGGTSERMLTLTGGTWPANAARGTVRIAGVDYDVESRVAGSDVILTLAVNSCPSADVTASSYEWFRDSYPLPVNFRRMLTIGETSTASAWYPLEYIPPSGFEERVKMDGGGPSDRPNYYTIRSSGDYLGAVDIVFGKAPNAARSYGIAYEVSPRDLATYKYSTGTVAVAAGATAVVGTLTVFSAAHVGSVMRLTESTTVEPTSPVGHVDGVLNPYLVQRVITAVADTTHCTIDSAVSAASSLSGVKYTISDPIDVEPIVMRSCFENFCAANYAKVQKREDYDDLLADAMRELILAMGQDSRSDQMRNAMYNEDSRCNWGTVDTDG